VTYSQAISAVGNGLYAWRAAWADERYIFGNPVTLYPEDLRYVPTPDDEGATDWDSGDHPPHK